MDCMLPQRELRPRAVSVPALTLAPLTGETSSFTTYSVSQSDCGHTSSTREFYSYLEDYIPSSSSKTLFALLLPEVIEKTSILSYFYFPNSYWSREMLSYYYILIKVADHVLTLCQGLFFFAVISHLLCKSGNSPSTGRRCLLRKRNQRRDTFLI